MKKPPAITGAYTLTAAVVLTLALLMGASLWLNGGQFFYIIDDPYISLALAERIADGHYGLNAGEFSAPASSLLWPFLLVPFIHFSWAHLAPFMLGAVACVASALLLRRTLAHVYPNHAGRIAFAVMFFLNGIGIVFTGLEHPLQIALCIFIISALIDLTEQRALPRGLMAALILAPLVRYELLGVSLGAVALLMAHRRFTYMACLPVIGLLLALASLYFLSHTGLLFPSSIAAKMHDYPASLTGNVYLIFLTLALMAAAFAFRRQPARLMLCGYALAIVLAQLFIGKSRSLERYEVYALMSGALVLLYYLPASSLWQTMKRADRAIVGFIAGACLLSYSLATAAIPGAAHAIYTQQVQMRRLLEQLHFPPVAVNDIGYISYRNPSYVMDIWGLAQPGILPRRRLHAPGWLSIVNKHGIGLVMLYPDWYRPEEMPKSWIKLGELESLDFPERIISYLGAGQVGIYATSDTAAGPIRRAINEWKTGLPQAARWHEAQ